MISLKEGVRLVALSPQIVFAHTVVVSVWPGDVMVTSGSEGNHTNAPRPSGHYAGNALDYRTRALWEGLHPDQRNPKVAALHASIHDALGPDFLVLIENLGKESEHLHCEWLPRRIL